MNQDISYSELYLRLCYETAIVRFMKKNGDVRIMLATRNIETASLLYDFLGGQLAGHDKRCNIKNKNMAVIDLEIGEARSFSVERLIDVEFCGEVNTKDDIEKVFEHFMVEQKQFNESLDNKLNMDMLD